MMKHEAQIQNYGKKERKARTHLNKNYHLPKKILTFGMSLAGIYALAKNIANRCCENNSIDKDNPYIKNVESRNDTGLYKDKIKPMSDKMLAFIGLIILSPLYLAIALAVVFDDPGPIFFTQKRVGKNGRYFMLHKYRSMRMDTPHNVPTHELKHPEDYITRVGRILRKSSLDELPQLWDIFRGKMSIIGPRPALWNQEDLISYRELYGANEILPGLTGLAQISGRDELQIADKAKLDGEYARILRTGGTRAALCDGTCFIKTITRVIQHDGIVEGGTGAIKNEENPGGRKEQLYW